MERKTVFRLYGTEGCHLCEEAVLQLQPLAHPQTWDSVDIMSNEALLAKYGTRIPVLRCLHTEAELNWPFDPEDLKMFLGQTDGHH